jgi:type I restriction enzyme, S subunit
MSSEWQEVSLESIAELAGGYAFKSEEYTEDGHFVLRTVNITDDGRIDRGGAAFVSPEAAKKYERFALKHLDTLFVMVGATLGKTGLVQKTDLPALLNQNMWVVRANPSLVCPLFLHYAFKVCSQPMLGMASGSARGFVKRDDFRQMSILLPIISEQTRISSLLGALDDRITLLRETNATLEAIAQALFKSWFVDFDPVRAKLEGRAPEGMDEATARLFPAGFEESELGLVPRGWRVATLADTFDINPTRKLSKGSMASYLDMASLATSGHCVEAPIEREMGSGAKFQNGDTLLARITPCLENGKSAFVDFLAEGQIGWGSTEFLVLRPKAPLPHYLGYLLCRHPAFREYAIQSMSGTSGRQRIQNDVLGRYLLAVPGLEIATVFAGVIEPIQQSIAANHHSAQTLATLRDTLLPRLISGQLRLPEAQAAAEEARV